MTTKLPTSPLNVNKEFITLIKMVSNLLNINYLMTQYVGQISANIEDANKNGVLIIFTIIFLHDGNKFKGSDIE